MGVLCENTIIGASGAGGYTIDQSLRFNDDDSSYLSRTPGSTGDRRTLTFSAWVKRGNLDSSTNWHSIFTAYTSGGSEATIAFREDAIRIQLGPTDLKTSAVYRDTSSWYHIVFVLDTENATSGDRQKLYVNGTRVSDFSIETQPSQNLDTPFNLSGNVHRLGTSVYNSSKLFDGYLAEVNFIDGQALTPSNFGETGDYGEWKPKKYTGTYDTNGFYLDFADSADLGNDVSGEGNDWTPTNLAATDQMLDSPTNNFCTWNPLTGDTDEVVFSEGNLKIVSTEVQNTAGGTIPMSSGKWYWESLITKSNTQQVGIIADQVLFVNGDSSAGDSVGGYIYLSNGEFYNNSSTSVSDTSYTTDDIIGVAFDADTRELWFAKNNTWQNSGAPASGTGEVFTVSSSYPSYVPAASAGGSSDQIGQITNFGQDSSFAGNKTAQGNQDGNSIGDFYYTPPTGFLALCTSNLPAVAVIPSEHYSTKLYSGTGQAGQAITGVGFQPDFVWTKGRGNQNNFSHALQDVLRGTGTDTHLSSDTTAEEGAYPAYHNFASFDSDGFTFGATSNATNRQSHTSEDYVSWNWKAGGSGSSNTNGSINTTGTTANTDAGFSISTWTGNATSGATVGHGLSKAPEMMINKQRSGSSNWYVYHKALGATKNLELEVTGAVNTTSNIWNDQEPTSTVSYRGNNGSVNGNTETYVTYHFHSVDGHSKVGSYTGNGNADGTFVYTGFRPAWVMIRYTGVGSWLIYDNKRSINNLTDDFLLAETAGAEQTDNSSTNIDMLSNGFKTRVTNDSLNESGSTYIYLAFAETPFKYANAR